MAGDAAARADRALGGYFGCDTVTPAGVFLVLTLCAPGSLQTETVSIGVDRSHCNLVAAEVDLIAYEDQHPEYAGYRLVEWHCGKREGSA